MTTKLGKVLVGGLMAAGLAACSFSASANLTVDADQLATEAAQALQEQTGASVLPELDCGDDAVDLVEGETVDCVLTAEGLDGAYDAEIVITEVDGTDYRFEVEVADEPRAS